MKRNNSVKVFFCFLKSFDSLFRIDGAWTWAREGIQLQRKANAVWKWSKSNSISKSTTHRIKWVFSWVFLLTSSLYLFSILFNEFTSKYIQKKIERTKYFPSFLEFYFLGFKSSNSRLNSSFPLSCLSRHYYKNNNEKVSSTLQKADSILPIQIDFMNVSYLLFSTFSWESSAYPLLSHYLQDYASYQDEMFSLIDHLTYHTFSSINNVDTTVYRQSIWKFTHRLLGILHNESDFSIICKQLFNTSMEFIQYMIEAPYAITRRDFQNISTKLTNGERCHFIIIVIEAYRQALLLYGIKAINNYLEVYH